jgi:micrococcal nuclease
VKRLFEWRAKCWKVHDGDTIYVTIDRGFEEWSRQRLRLLGVNAPEIRGASREAGDAATAFLQGVIDSWQTEADGEWPLYIRTEKGDSFGRWLATVYRASDFERLGTDAKSLTDLLLESDHGVVYARRR